MEKILFTNTQLKKLEEICRNKESVFVEGKNGIGENFFVKACIRRDERGETMVTNDMVYLVFGSKMGELTSLKTPCYAPFFLNAERRTLLNDQLIIKTIKDERGKTIFKNNGFASQEQIFEQNKKAIENSTNQVIEFDPVTAKIEKLVGNPVMLDGVHGVVVGIIGITEMGYPQVLLLTGSSSIAVTVKNTSILFVEEEDGKINCLADNAKEECFSIFQRNRECVEKE